MRSAAVGDAMLNRTIVSIRSAPISAAEYTPDQWSTIDYRDVRAARVRKDTQRFRLGN
jgi:hypothetical protein